jgi:predicted lipid-binding transport protein (Tim44 family)
MHPAFGSSPGIPQAVEQAVRNLNSRGMDKDVGHEWGTCIIRLARTDARQPKETPMKSLILALSMAVAAAGLMPLSADAKRIGGGASSGMKRDMPARTPDATPAKPAQAAPAATPGAAAAPAAAPKRSWMGPLAGLAAGLGLAALMSHLGLGEGFANIIMMVLLAVVAFVAIRFLLQRFGPKPQSSGMNAAQGLQFAGAGAPAPVTPSLPSGSSASWGPAAVAPEQSAAAAFASASAARSSSPSLPAGFDAAAFERVAKMIFIRMQAANDIGDLNDLRTFTTPEMFASIKLDLQERGGVAQTTDVVRIDAEIVDFTAEAERQIVSVRFHGQVREEKDAAPADVDEVWHLVKPTDGSREWAIAGIQQYA